MDSWWIMHQLKVPSWIWIRIFDSPLHNLFLSYKHHVNQDSNENQYEHKNVQLQDICNSHHSNQNIIQSYKPQNQQCWSKM